MDVMGTAIVVVLLALVGVGIVIDQLLRLKAWLDKPPPPSRGPQEPPDETV